MRASTATGMGPSGESRMREDVIRIASPMPECTRAASAPVIRTAGSSASTRSAALR